MRVLKQALGLPITNLDDISSVKKNIGVRHSKLLPNSIRAIICGPSGMGKTNIMMSLLFHPHGLRYENVYIYSKTLYQEKYILLKKILDGISGLGCYMFKDSDDIVEPSKARPHSIFIFDDVATENQKMIRAYFSMGRHNSIDSFYLCQTYTRIPKHLIRDNANVLICFRQDEMNLKHIFEDHVRGDFTFEKFKEICSICWDNDKYGTLVIMKDFDLSNGRYRKGFDNYIVT